MTNSTNDRRRGRLSLLLAVVAAMPWACVDATDVELLEIAGTGDASGQAYLDLDATNTLTLADSTFPLIDVWLLALGTGEMVDMSVTDSSGVFVFEDVPVGVYDLAFDMSVLGDSLFQIAPSEPVTIELGAVTQANMGATFERLTLEEALAAPVGTRVTASGIGLNRRVNSGPGQVHFKGESLFLRGLDADRGQVSPGDSVQFVGTVVMDNGRPALQNVSYTVLIQGVQLIAPDDLSTADAATADGGPLDAGLVRIQTAEITDTSTTVDGDFRFWADDGSDSVEVVIREFLIPTVNTSAFRPDTIVRIQSATGLLSPFDDGGTVRWRVLPRDGSDIVLEQKSASIGVSTAFDTTTASQGDTVGVTVVIANGGPHLATGVQVTDTIPAGATFVSATATRGTFDDATGLWDIGDLGASTADTLRIRLEVTATAPALLQNIAEFLGLTFEVDVTGTGDDTSVGSLNIS